MTINSSYLNSLWSSAFESVGWFQTLCSTDSPQVLAQEAALLYETFTAGANTVNALQLIDAFTNYATYIAQIEALPVNYGVASRCLAARSNGLPYLIFNLSSVLPAPPTTPAALLLSAGQPAIQDADFLSVFSLFQAETYGQGTMQNIADWQTVQVALISYYGKNPTSLVDAASYTVQASANIGALLAANGLSNPQGAFQYNQCYSLPVCLEVANFLSSNMSDATSQQAYVLEHILRAMARNVSDTLLASVSPSPQNVVNTTYTFGNESLQDVANRVLGDFEQWTTIGALNNIQPGTQPAPGTFLVLPPSQSVSGFSYNVNVLGRDIYIGPVSGTMPTWTGDFQTISGPDNLIGALSRRLLTTLGSFVYHSDYGSRIPPEVGAVQSLSTLQHIAAFGKSAIAQDPRVASVLNASASGNATGWVSFQASILPIGPQALPVQINEVINP